MNQTIEHEAPFEVPPPQEQHEREDFHVHDERSADWVLSKIANARAEKHRIEEWAAEGIKRCENEEERLRLRFEPELEAFAKEALKDGKRKSLKLPNGVIGFRASQPKLLINEPQELEDWAKRNLPHAAPAMITVDVTKLPESEREAILEQMHERELCAQIEVSFRKTPINEHFKATGEVPDGCEGIAGKDEFYIGKDKKQ